MFWKLADNTNPNSTASKLRQRRLEAFFHLVDLFPRPVSVLDVGGTPAFWRETLDNHPGRIRLTLLNLSATEVKEMPDTRFLSGDARNLSRFPDQAFRVCFSNSVIEHVGNFFDQYAMAREVARVSHAYFVQTPNRHFPMEPHFHVPFWSMLPLVVRAWLHRRMDLGWMKRQPDPCLARAEVEQVRLLTRNELKFLFPDSKIIVERFAGLTKSLMAVRQPVQ